MMIDRVEVSPALDGQAQTGEELRLRSVGAPGVRAALLTVLGEYVAQRNRDVYRDVYIAALQTLGYGAHAARQGLARSVAAGWLVSDRIGRRSQMTIAPATHEMLRAGYPRIYGFGEPSSWAGKWLLVVVRVPEERREVRDRMRTQLAWAGFGSLGGGLWISPHAGRDVELLSSIDQIRDGADLISFTAEIASLGNPAEVVSRAWDLERIAELYHAFIADFSALRPSNPSRIFAAHTALVHAWRRFPFLDPDLPEQLLPPTWPRAEGLTLFRQRHSEWANDAEDYFRSLELTGASPGAGRRREPTAQSMSEASPIVAQ